MPLKNILVPSDFSRFSDKAVEIALFLAEKYAAQITLLHTVLLFQEDGDEAEQMAAYEAFVKAKESQIQKQFDRQMREAGRRGVGITSAVLRGFSAADSILSFLKERDFDLVVMGTHGRTGIKKWIFGSVAEKVLRLSPVPVLTTHYFEPPFTLEKILVPVDFSEHSRKAIAFARDLAGDFGARLVFLHAITPALHPAYYAMGTQDLLPLDQELKKRSAQQLREFVGETVGDTFVITEGAASQTIVDYAEQHEISLIVMATRGLTGLDHLLIGSTTERVVRLSRIPVLTIERRDLTDEQNTK